MSLSRLDGGKVRRRRLSRRAERTSRADDSTDLVELATLLEDSDDLAEDTVPAAAEAPDQPGTGTQPLPLTEHSLPERNLTGPDLTERPGDQGAEHVGAVDAEADTGPIPIAAATTRSGPASGPVAAGTVTGSRGRLRRRPRRVPFWVLIGRTLSKAWHDRILGLAAEAGFWQLLSLPPLLLAVFGTIGYVGDALGHDVAARIETSLLDAARHILTPSTVTDSVQPTVEDVLRNGRPDVISIGFLISIWSGSTAMSTYVNTITIAYGERHERNAIRSRLLALRLYLAQVLTGVVLLPALVLGPTLLDRILHQRVDRWARTIVTVTYWPIVAVLSLSILTSLYHLSVPHRRPWRRALPGSVLALVIWLVGCYGLRYYVSAVYNRAVVYGTLAAPVAVLLFFYITAFAVLLGAEFNATLDQARREREGTSRVH